MNDVSRQKYNYIRAEELLRKEKGLELLKDDKMPLLPEWNEDLTLPPSFDEFMESGNEEKVHTKQKENN